VQATLRRTAEALQAERALTSEQLQALREAHGRLSRAQTELVASERLATVGRLAAGVAHEIGNPLSGVLGYLSLARERARGQPAVLELLTAIDDELQRINQIVRGLLDLGRPPGAELELVPLQPVVERCVRLARAGPEFTHVEVNVSVEDGLVARAQGGPLGQVLLNLLLNAAQAMEGRGQIEVRARRQGAEVVVTVSDSGPGIPPEVLPSIFEPFFTTKSAGQGTGLGLAISRHLVGGMGGRLEAKAASRGALFAVHLTAA
jgi:C4-dicarboxylate-specific signal transduction histidine kinase